MLHNENFLSVTQEEEIRSAIMKNDVDYITTKIDKEWKTANILLRPFNSSLLIIAANEGQVAMVEALIQNGADANHFDRMGSYAIDYASLKGHLEIVKILLPLTDPSNLDYALAYASSQSQNQITNLIKQKALPNSHWIVQRVIELRPNLAKTNIMKGICNGVAEASALISDIDRFNKNFELMRLILPKDFKRKATEDHKKLIDSLLAFQDPESYLQKNLTIDFKGIKNLILRVCDSTINQIALVPKISPDFSDEDLKEKGGSTAIALLSGIYTKNELVSRYLRPLREFFDTLSANQQPAYFHISLAAVTASHDSHAIAIRYDFKSKDWILVDFNQYPIANRIGKDDDEMANKIFIHLVQCSDESIVNPRIAFSSKVSVEKNLVDFISPHIVKWEKDMNDLHNVNERANIESSTKEFWINVAVRGGNIETSRALMKHTTFFNHHKYQARDAATVTVKVALPFIIAQLLQGSSLTETLRYSMCFVLIFVLALSLRDRNEIRCAGKLSEAFPEVLKNRQNFTVNNNHGIEFQEDQEDLIRMKKFA
ncbi:MAG: ankyrin repeat domain-containing protein [Gammaproteobacteria bacterium]|nr:ankyrin repeat domain-containing protein [Gammaproteobacteria bacterium]